MVNKGMIVDDFIPGKAYLIKSKGIDQVKSEIKEWLSKNEVEIVKDQGNEIQGLKTPFEINSIGVWLHLKLSEASSGTLIVYDNRLFRTELLPFTWPFTNIYLEELRKDLVRYLQVRPELIVGSFDKLTTKVKAISSIPFFLAIITIFVGPKILGTYWITIIITFVFLYLVLNSSTQQYLKRKIQTLSNLPEYKVEEYKGEIESG